jgi:hypothetical protein
VVETDKFFGLGYRPNFRLSPSSDQPLVSAIFITQGIIVIATFSREAVLHFARRPFCNRESERTGGSSLQGIDLIPIFRTSTQGVESKLHIVYELKNGMDRRATSPAARRLEHGPR